MESEYFKKLQYLHDIVTQAYSVIISQWYNNCFLTWQWWLCVALFIIPWAVWIKYRKKESTGRLLLAGFVVIAISTHLDTIGVLLGIWSYNIDIILLFPCLIIFDLSLLPVSTMFLLQYKPNANPLIKAVIYSIIASFIMQPLFTWLEFYNPQNWKHYYSLPIFILLYLLANYCVTNDKFNKL